MMFVKVDVSQGSVPMILGYVCSPVCSFYVVTSKQVNHLACAHESFVVIVVIGHVLDDDCDVSFLMSILVRLRAACTMRGLALYLGCLRLWCCQFGVVISNPMLCYTSYYKAICNHRQYSDVFLHSLMNGCSRSLYFVG